MSQNSKIEWTDATWNPVRGCSRVSEGCRHCYAERVAARFSGPCQPYEGLAVIKSDGAHWTGKVELIDQKLTEPLHWKAPRRIFVNSMSDLFHEAMLDEWIDQVFAVMALCPQHTFQILTKRPERMLAYFASFKLPEAVDRAFNTCAWAHGVMGENVSGEIERIPRGLPNVWLGVSVEDQKNADERIPLLLQTPAAVRWISAEPLLGPIQLLDEEGWGGGGEPPLTDGVPTKDQVDGPNGFHFLRHGASRIDWVVVGGESGSGARPMHPDWARTLRNQCSAAGVPFFFKQWGEWLPSTDRPSDMTSHHTHVCRKCGRAEDDFQNIISTKGTSCCHDGCYGMIRIGKKHAGSLLDGVEHKHYPEASE